MSLCFHILYFPMFFISCAFHILYCFICFSYTMLFIYFIYHIHFVSLNFISFTCILVIYFSLKGTYSYLFLLFSFCLRLIYHECNYALLYSYIHINISSYSHILLSHVCIISFMRFYHDLAIHVLSIFLSCMLLLIHIFVYVPIICVLVLIPMLYHLLLISIVLIIYAFLSCVPSMFHHIHFSMSIIYSYHIILYSYVPIIQVL